MIIPCKRILGIILSRFYWVAIHEHVLMYCKTCDRCQRFKCLKRLNAGRLNPKNIQYPWHTVSVDLQGPFPSSYGYRYVMVVIDCFTRWCILIPLQGKSALEVANNLVKKVIMEQVVSRFY